MDHVPALDDITFEVKRGDQVAIIGPNGAGKSTLFHVITGLVAPTSGRVDVYGGEPNEHHCIGYVPQRNQIDWRFPVTVRDVVMMGRVGRIGLFRRPRRHDRDMVAAALEAVGIADLAQRQIGELSDGQQQRVFLARALAQETHLLLLDEPLSALDIPSQEAILTILADFRKRGVTTLISTHDLDQAVHFQRILLLNCRLIAYGQPNDVLTYEHLDSAYGSRFRFMPWNSGQTPAAASRQSTCPMIEPGVELSINPLAYGFMWRGMLAAIMVGIICPVLGSFVVLRGMAFLGDALAHIILPGVVLAYLLGWPLAVGALLVGILAAIGIGAAQSPG